MKGRVGIPVRCCGTSDWKRAQSAAICLSLHLQLPSSTNTVNISRQLLPTTDADAWGQIYWRCAWTKCADDRFSTFNSFWCMDVLRLRSLLKIIQTDYHARATVELCWVKMQALSHDKSMRVKSTSDRCFSKKKRSVEEMTLIVVAECWNLICYTQAMAKLCWVRLQAWSKSMRVHFRLWVKALFLETKFTSQALSWS